MSVTTSRPVHRTTVTGAADPVRPAAPPSTSRPVAPAPAADVPARGSAARVRRHDAPVPLPPARGRVSAALLVALRGPVERPIPDGALRWPGVSYRAPLDDDLQLAVWLVHELQYRGLAGVADDWDDDPRLAAALRDWESVLVDGLQRMLVSPDHPVVHTAADVVSLLSAMAADEGEPSLSQRLMRDADETQFVEFLTHKSLYHLKEADPHSWGLPRLSGSVKAAMVTIQADEYGMGETAAMHAELFRAVLASWRIDDTYGAHLARVPAVTLLTTNLISLFGRRRRWRGALVGHLAMFEMSSTAPNARYARAHRRLGGDDAAARFFDEHVVADALHEQIALHHLAGGLAAAEPDLAGDIVFGAQCAVLADDLFARHLIEKWDRGRSSLLPAAAVTA